MSISVSKFSCSVYQQDTCYLRAPPSVPSGSQSGFFLCVCCTHVCVYFLTFYFCFLKQEKNLPAMNSSGELTTERIRRPRSPMSTTDLAHDDDYDDDVSVFFSPPFHKQTYPVFTRHRSANYLFKRLGIRICNQSICFLHPELIIVSTQPK